MDVGDASTENSEMDLAANDPRRKTKGGGRLELMSSTSERTVGHSTQPVWRHARLCRDGSHISPNRGRAGGSFSCHLKGKTRAENMQQQHISRSFFYT